MVDTITPSAKQIAWSINYEVNGIYENYLDCVCNKHTAFVKRSKMDGRRIRMLKLFTLELWISFREFSSGLQQIKPVMKIAYELQYIRIVKFIEIHLHRQIVAPNYIQLG